jgi:hypothetical protein
MNSTGLYPARSYSAPGLAACRAHGPKGRGGLLVVAQPMANAARPAQASATHSVCALGGHRT